ncbi:MAG: hypothetical protein R3E83_14795 [Burkholderiaceae bacterium]
MNRKLIAAGLIGLTLGTAACRSPNLVMDIQDAPIRPARASEASVYKAIADAGASLGWILRKKAPGQAEGTLNLRRHKATVDISYSAASYSIRYKDSENLSYDADKRTIHPNYNGWIDNLNNAIALRLAEQ